MAISNVEEDLEGPRVLGIGLGLFLLILLWSFSLVGSLLLSRLSSGISTAIILGAGTIYRLIVVDNILKSACLKIYLPQKYYFCSIGNDSFGRHSQTSPSIYIKYH